MGVREAINRNSAVSTIVIVCAVAICLVAIGVELRGDNGKPPAKNFFTTDDGKTWFADSSSRLPPFDYDGAKAVRCYVFKGSGGKFVGLLEKYSDDTLALLAHAAKPPTSIPVMVKKPGDKDWKNIGPEEESVMIMRMVGPDGAAADRVMP